MSRTVVMATCLACVLGGIFICGCPRQEVTIQENDREVAGTEEQRVTVPVTITSDRLTVERERVPAGDVVLNIANDSSTVQTLRVSGQDIDRTSEPIPPGEEDTLRLQGMEPGTYTVTVTDAEGRIRRTAILEVTDSAEDSDSATATLALTDRGFTMNPATLPYGDITLTLINRTDRTKTLVFGEGESASRLVLLPGEEARLPIRQEDTDRVVFGRPRKASGTAGE